MADLKISEMTDGGTVQDTDQIPVVRSGDNNRVQVGSMAAEDATDYTKTSGLAAVALSGVAGDVSYANSGSGLTATDVQGAIDEIAAGTGGGGNVEADNNIADNAIVRGDGGAKKVQTSSASVDDSGNLIANTFAAQTLTSFLMASQGGVTVKLTAPTASSNRTYSFPNASGPVVLAGNSSTLTNKTINGPDNTLTNIPAAALSGEVPLANGGTGANLTDPNADRILFWDDSAGAVTWLTAGTGLTISGTTIEAAGGGSGVFTEEYSSSAQSITSGASIILAHGMSKEPLFITGKLLCTSDQAGYLAGQSAYISINPANGSSIVGRGFTARADGTYIYVRLGSNGNPFQLLSLSSGETVDLTNINWNLIVEAYA